MAKIPKEWHRYFWEVNPEKVDTQEHAFYILGRILEYGDKEAVKNVRKIYGDRLIRKFLLSTNSRVLSNRTMKHWQTILKLRPEECTKISLIRSKNPTWNY
ncbi:MAG: DUF6922 domain-containing protein [bacterium]